MRYWSTEHSLSHPWSLVASGYWWRYPNPHSSHVFSVDTLEIKQEGNLLYTKRLVLKTNSLPSWGKHFFADAKVAVIEESLVDRSSPSLTWYTRNIGLTPFMATVERVTLAPSSSSPSNTSVVKECWIDSSIFGFRSAIKKFGVDRYKKNCDKATQGFEMVLARHVDGSCPYNRSHIGPISQAVKSSPLGESLMPVVARSRPATLVAEEC